MPIYLFLIKIGTVNILYELFLTPMIPVKEVYLADAELKKIVKIL